MSSCTEEVVTKVDIDTWIGDEKELQDIAHELGITYYSSFKVWSCAGHYFPMAEVYENGRWRRVVVGGRPYHNKGIAHRTAQDAAKAQKSFLKTMYEVRNHGNILNGLTNPIDHWKYHLEID